jgi:hypothetical protein
MGAQHSLRAFLVLHCTHCRRVFPFNEVSAHAVPLAQLPLPVAG